MDTKTLYAKLAKVPIPIKTGFGSDAAIDAIEKTEDQFNLPHGSSGIISKIIQGLETKDLGAEYFAGEIASKLNLDKNKALLISSELKKSIFIPLKKEFSDYGIDISLLDKFEMPIIKTGTSSLGPKIIQEIKPAPMPAATAPKAPGPAPMPAPQIISQSFSATAKFSAAPLDSNKNIPAVPMSMPKPASLSGPGWSKQAPQGPVIKLGSITPGVPAPSASSQQTPTTQTNSASSWAAPSPSMKGMSEFERLDMMKKGASVAPGPIMPTSSEPAPVMLHEISPINSIQKTNDFHINAPMQNQMGTQSSQPLSVRPAVLELGGNPQPSQQPPAKVVHYTDYKAPTPANTGPRQITEMTAQTAQPMPKQAYPAQPTQPPRPPQMPGSQQKVIIKDFLQ